MELEGRDPGCVAGDIGLCEESKRNSLHMKMADKADDADPDVDIIIDKQGKLIPPADTIRSGGVDTICPVVLGILTKIRFKQKPIQEEMGEQEQEQEQKVVPGSNNTRTPASPHDNEQCVKAVSKCVIWEADNDSLDKDITREFAERCVPDQPGGLNDKEDENCPDNLKDSTPLGERKSVKPKDDNTPLGETKSVKPKDDNTPLEETKSVKPKDDNTPLEETKSVKPKDDNTPLEETKSVKPKDDNTPLEETKSVKPKDDNTPLEETKSVKPEDDNTPLEETKSVKPKDDNTPLGETKCVKPKDDNTPLEETKSVKRKEHGWKFVFRACLVLVVLLPSFLASPLTIYCGPGQMLTRGQNGIEECKICPVGHFQDKHHHRDEECDLCATFDKYGHSSMKLVKNCTASQNTVMRCREERMYYTYDKEGGSCDFCTNCSEKGQFTGQNCTETEDAICCKEQNMIVRNGVCEGRRRPGADSSSGSKGKEADDKTGGGDGGKGKEPDDKTGGGDGGKGKEQDDKTGGGGGKQKDHTDGEDKGKGLVVQACGEHEGVGWRGLAGVIIGTNVVTMLVTFAATLFCVKKECVFCEAVWRIIKCCVENMKGYVGQRTTPEDKEAEEPMRNIH